MIALAVGVILRLARAALAVMTLAMLTVPIPLLAADSGTRVPILLYHRLGPVVADSMTIVTSVFESHLKYLKQNGYTVIPLRELVDYQLKKRPSLPPQSVVIVVDDGHKSVYSDMLPLVKKYNVPVTLFIYPSAISNASYAMTWDQLRQLKGTGLFDLQSHTYWHPNFKTEKKRLPPNEYDKLIDMQLKKSRDKLQKEFGANVDLLAWPFGIYDDHLMTKAKEAGYVAAFSIERHHAGNGDNIMALPRYLLGNANQGKVFESILRGGTP
ncbi:polysaccharide deacetylase family protein [Candidatus Magnetobacterium casense]|nr:polysaccharide deacetylase family protein [Candidatus Magnetobacterium casensis]